MLPKLTYSLCLLSDQLKGDMEGCDVREYTSPLFHRQLTAELTCDIHTPTQDGRYRRYHHILRYLADVFLSCRDIQLTKRLCTFLKPYFRTNICFDTPRYQHTGFITGTINDVSYSIRY